MTNDPMKQCLREQLLREEVSSKHGRDRFDRIELKSMLAVMDDLRARVAELESAPTDAEIEEWMMNARTSKTGCKGPVCVLTASDFDRAVSLMRRAKAAEAKDGGSIESEDVAVHVNHRRLAVNVLHRIVEAAAGRDRPDYSDAEKIVDAILRAARGGAT